MTQKQKGDKKVPAQKKEKGEKKAKSQSSLTCSRIFLILSVLITIIVGAGVSWCRTNGQCQTMMTNVAHDLVKYFHQTSPKNTKSEGGTDEKTSEPNWMKGPIPNSRILNDDEIKYVENGPLYLVIVGHVFDVTAGKDYYAPGTGYFGFIGKDGSRAFISGEFNENGLVNELDGLSHSDYLGLANWIKFYFEKYTFIGYHAGRFFDKKGKETDYMKKFKGWVKSAELNEEEEMDLKKLFPPCNAQWSASDGSNLWCTNQSGGIKRDWIGVPRQFFENKESPRCACVHPNYLADPRVRPYENCDPKSTSCRPPNTD